jgi:putative adenylate-forming enzyme
MNVNMLFRLLTNSRRLRAHDQWTRLQLKDYQTHMLQKLRDYAYTHSPFYRKFHSGLQEHPLHELPVLTKKLMMEHFDDLVTDRAVHLLDVRSHMQHKSDTAYLGRYWVNATSGTSGSPGIFLFNRREWAMVLASFARGYEWAGVHVDLTHHRKMAVVSSITPWHMSYLVGTTLRSPWVSTLRLSAAEPLNNLVQQLNEYEPEILISYASMARILAVEQLEARLNIRPRLVFTSSEALTDESRRLIESAWGRILFNQYAATETAGIAAECEQHIGMHLYEDLVVIENVDEHYQPVPAGVYGSKLLVSVLFNHTQPLIRYELNDSLRFSEQACPSGRIFTLVDSVQGRQEDTLMLNAENGDKTSVHPNIFHEVMDSISVSAWQIVLRRNGLYVLVTDALDNEQQLVASIRNALDERGIKAPDIFVEVVSAVPRTANGKAPLIRAELE